MKRMALCIVLVVFSWSEREATAAPVSIPAGMRGVWEGIGQGDFRVFRLEVASQENNSLLVMAAGQSKTVNMVFNVTSIDVRDKVVEMHTTGADGPDDLRITGRVERLSNMGSDGMIEGKVSRGSR